MLNKVMMTGRLISEPAVNTENGCQCCRFEIEVKRPRRYETDTTKSGIFICISYDRNADMIYDLFSKGEVITLVGSLRNAPDNSAEIVVEEVHITSGRQTVAVADTRMLF